MKQEREDMPEAKDNKTYTLQVISDKLAFKTVKLIIEVLYCFNYINSLDIKMAEATYTKNQYNKKM